jgi:hypothetical protein
MAGCTAPRITQGVINVLVIADGKQVNLEMPSGTTVQHALENTGISLENLDRVRPPVYTLLSDQSEVRVIRVREEFEVEETILPFTSQTIYNESLPNEQKMRIQKGENGIQQNTYRRVFEDNLEVSRSLFKSETIQEPQPEIWMVGRQTTFHALDIPGQLAYLSAGNAWIMTGNTSDRRPLVTSGDLDGRVFALSPNGEWLLFTRKSAKDPSEEINTLWVVSTSEKPVEFDLNTKNIIHYAEWVPGTETTVTYSTVEPRATAPGWQANNDLFLLTFSPISGTLRKQEEIYPANTGGVYGWWGTTFSWSPDAESLVYARTDKIGLVELGEKPQLIPLLEVDYYNTHSGWAWVPGIAWAPDKSFLYIVTHAPQFGLIDQETSPLFNLTAFGINNSVTLDLSLNTGMFAYPSPSPLTGNGFWIAFLQATIPDQSETSAYRLVLMDRDGSNRRVVFPLEGSRGLEPQKVVWSPDSVDQRGFAMAVLFQGNLWLVWTDGQNAQQITGDGSILKIDWK